LARRIRGPSSTSAAAVAIRLLFDRPTMPPAPVTSFLSEPTNKE
jgi:hypothetical protein